MTWYEDVYYSDYIERILFPLFILDCQKCEMAHSALFKIIINNNKKITCGNQIYI